MTTLPQHDAWQDDDGQWRGWIEVDPGYVVHKRRPTRRALLLALAEAAAR
jgi:hypothetical protein